jgi:hypothetical protein
VFSEWADNFVSYIGLHKAEFGLVDADLDQLLVDHPQWDGALDDHVEFKALAKMKCAVKNDKREAFEATIRLLVQRINGNPAVTDAMREALGIKSVPVVPVGMGMDIPHAIINAGGRLKHVLRIVNETETGVKRARPAGAIGCELWRKVGEAPAGTEGLEYVGLVRKSPVEVDYSAADGGKQAHYMMRWLDSSGEHSGWSAVESATIAA